MEAWASRKLFERIWLTGAMAGRLKDLVCLVYLVYSVYLVCLVCLD